MDDSNPGSGDGQAGQPSPEATIENLSAIVDGETLQPVSTRDVFLFAYDVLMDQEYIARYVKGLIPQRQVYAPNHRLAWPLYYPPSESALPTLVRTNSEADRVWGILYNARTADFKLLDRHLNLPGRYHRRALRVVDQGGRRFGAITYVLTLEPGLPDIPPGRAYLGRVIAAARERKLPADWIASLDALTPQM